MAINFPDSPSVNDTHTVGDRTWKWDGAVWNIVSGTTPDHGNLAGLSDDDHTQYLRTDGTRTAASLTVSGAVTVDTDTFVVDNVNDRVGIGTTSPAAELDIKGASNPEIRLQSTDSTDPFLYFGDQVDAVRGGIGYDVSADALQLRGYNNNTRMTIDSSGQVGIGTTSPTAELDIASTGDATINLLGSVDNTNNINFHAHDGSHFWHLSGPRSGDDAFRFYYYNGSAYTESLYQNTSGHLGSKGTYDLTTPSTSSLVHVSTSSYQYRFFRSTSRRDAKTDIESITDDNALALLQSRPVWFRSALSHDDPTLSYYGFIAEELAEIDPRLCTWEAGRVLKEGDYASENERLCTCPDNENLVHTFDHEPECIQVAGVDYGRLTAHLTKIAQLQQSTIDSQQTQIDALTARIEALENP